MIDSFRGDYNFLSNFYQVVFTFGGHHWNSVEHAFQAYKTDDPVEFDRIKMAPSPARAKALGREVKLREGWEDIKLRLMKRLLQAKFSQNWELGHKLVLTYPHELVEGNWWYDTFWGVCRGVGENHLGKLLMEVREEIMRGTTNVEGRLP